MEQEIHIIDYDSRYKADFANLNIEWLEKYYKVEQVDKDYFANPEKKILNNGGSIYFAKIANKIVGTCALVHESDGIYEIAKMGVTSNFQGKGIGAKLLQHCIDEYKNKNGKELFLETHHYLQAAIRLYERFGFVNQGHRKPGSVYERSDVYMIWQE